MSGLIRHLSIWQSHVFLLNSRLGLFTAASLSLEEAPLLPKLQGHFAEFLGRDSLEHLRILSPTTCVGLRYGPNKDTVMKTFLGSSSGSLSRRPKPLSTISTKSAFNAQFRLGANPCLLRHSHYSLLGYGNIHPLAIEAPLSLTP